MNFGIKVFNILTVKNPKQLYAISKAKQEYLKLHQECAICGNMKTLECHHVIPVHIDLELSCNFDNFISLCDSNNNSCHRWFGHFGNFKTKWNPHIRQYALATRLFLQKAQPDRKFIISTTKMVDEFSQALDITTKEFLEQVEHFNK
jgi:hypothetical protein